ncbi:MAG: alpha/beta hydrolase [Pseudonocardia sp.]
MSRRAVTALGLAGLLAAAGARRPLIRRWPVSIIQAGPCTLASELPGLLAVAHGAAVAVALVRGGGRRRDGLAGAAVNALAAAALVDLHRDTARSAAVLDAVLAPLGVAAGGPAQQVRGGRAGRRAYRRAADIGYGDDPAQRLDVWARPGLPRDGAAPVLVQVHGGGWTGGDKAGSGAPLLGYLAERGWVCVTANYRLGPGHRWPAMIVDVKRAIGWVGANIAHFGGDPGFMAISGGSAGGHLAALAALSPNDPDFQPGFAGVDTTLAAAVPLYGVHDFSVDEYGLFALLEGKVFGTTHIDDAGSWRQASPLHRAGPHAPPFFVIHGSADTVSSVNQSRRLVHRLRQVSRHEVCYAELPRAQHGFDGLPTARTALTVDAVHRFLTVVHDRYRSRDGVPGRHGMRVGPLRPNPTAAARPPASPMAERPPASR